VLRVVVQRYLICLFCFLLLLACLVCVMCVPYLRTTDHREVCALCNQGAIKKREKEVARTISNSIEKTFSKLAISPRVFIVCSAEKSKTNSC
jgi:hypothetical protein